MPFFRVIIGDDEISEVVDVLRSGWLTTGSRVNAFQNAFAEALNVPFALAVNSCTAALHLAVEAMNVGPGDGILVPSLTFAATAEIVRYTGATPVLVDCDPVTLNMDLADAERKVHATHTGALSHCIAEDIRVVGMIPVHVAGFMMDLDAIETFTRSHGLWYIEDAAHAFPAAWRPSANDAWRRCGSGHSRAACFSFYANKTITTGEGGMVITRDPEMADRMKQMSLHGLSRDAWERYSGGASWDYRIVAPGFKYNMTDIAAALGIHQLNRAESMRLDRERCALHYGELLSGIDEIELPVEDSNRIHSRHLFPIRLRTGALTIDRNTFVQKMKESGVGFSVHWRPLHLHPYYETQGWHPDDCPAATCEWERLISLPLFSGMTDREIDYVSGVVKTLIVRNRRGV
ncbi:MAG TPA: DegT/DnrJ/EryC1/StrS family aminotransferase [bacterium]|nr:DegT/DnrJ/EryC1/StrS family aminotransferase [bacterium]